MALKNKDLISIHDLSVGEVATILDVSRKLKKKQKMGEPHEYLKGKTLAMIFSKASTRTRVSFETGFHQLGGHPIYMSEATSQIGRGEPVKDTARVLSRFVDGIMIRTYSHEAVKELAAYASVPVINGLTDLLHPCQALTDLFTIMEYKEVLKGRKLVFVGDGNNMAHSLMYACAKVGMNMVCASPKGYYPDPQVLKQAQEEAKPFRLRVLNFLLGHLGLVAVGIIVFLVLLIPVFLSLMLPFVGYFIIIAAIFFVLRLIGLR